MVGLTNVDLVECLVKVTYKEIPEPKTPVAIPPLEARLLFALEITSVWEQSSCSRIGY